MIKLLGLALLVLSSLSIAITIERKGQWSTVCNGVEVSNHYRYDKALESAINQNIDCDIIPPEKFEIRQVKVIEIEQEATESFLISWRKPTGKEDGSLLTKIDRFNLYYGVDGDVQNVIQVEASSTSYTLANVKAGSYTFQMSTVSNGIEGSLSPFLVVN